jgi:stage V sporulation protein R
VEQYGQTRVEQVLDAALALEAHIDPEQLLRRERYPQYLEGPRAPNEGGFQKRFENLPGSADVADAPLERARAPLPPSPERDLLWLIAEYAPEIEEWERDIFRAVREESFYFYPVFACQIINEGWASYWHARLLREADFLPHNEYLDALKTHSDVVRPHAAEQQASLATNPYHLGFSIWESIVEEHGLERAFQIRAEDDDFSFIRNHLTQELAEELTLFRYERNADGSVKVLDHDVHALRETVLKPKYNFGAPAVLGKHIAHDGSLTLFHEHETDGRGLDLDRAERVLDYLHKIWRRPIKLETVDAAGQARTLARSAV